MILLRRIKDFLVRLVAIYLAADVMDDVLADDLEYQQQKTLLAYYFWTLVLLLFSVVLVVEGLL